MDESKHVKAYLFILACLVHSCFLFSQQGLSDSLLRALEKTPSDSLKAAILNQLHIHSVGSDPDKSMEYCRQALTLGERIKNKRIIAQALHNICTTYDYKGDYKNATEYALRSLSIREEIKDSSGITLSYMVLGNICLYRNLFSEARDYLLKALDIESRRKNKNALSGIYNNLGVMSQDIKHYDEAKVYYTKSLKISEEINDRRLMAQAYNNIGNIYYFKKNYEKCLEHYFKALKLNEELGEKYQLAGISSNIGMVYADKGDFKNAVKMLQSSLAISKETESIDIEAEDYGNLATVYANMKNFAEAYKYSQLYATTKDTVLNKESGKQIAEMQAKYNSEKKDKEIQLLNKDKALNGAEIAKQKAETGKKNAQRNVFIVGFSLVLLLAGFIFNGLKQQRKANHIISEQKEEVEKAKEVIENQKELVEEKQKEIIDSINYAKRIQYALFAHKDFMDAHLSGERNFIFFKPKDIVSGDFYWATSALNKANEELFYLACCDSTGHGVPGAFMSLLNIGFLSEAIKEKDIFEPGRIFDYVRNRLINSISKEEQKDGFDGILLCINKRTGTLTYSAANNNPVLVSGHQLNHLPTDKMPVGKGEKSEAFSTFTITAGKNDLIYLYTDGYADQFGGPKGKKFKYKQLENLLITNSGLPLSEQSEILNTKFEEWRNGLEQVDDVLVIGIKT